MPTTTPIRIDTGDTFRITNVGDRTYTFVWNKRTWRLQPTQSEFVPFDVIRLYFGDPRSIIGTSKSYQDSRGKGEIAKREDEIERLAVLYGVYADGIHELMTKAPACRITTANGDEIVMPIFDPTGATIPGETNPVDINNITDINAVVANLQEQINNLQRHRDNVRANGPNTTDDVEVDGDDIDFA